MVIVAASVPTVLPSCKAEVIRHRVACVGGRKTFGGRVQVTEVGEYRSGGQRERRCNE